MEKCFYLRILTPKEKIYEGDVSSLVVPAVLGYLGVLFNHAALIAKLVKGKIILKDKVLKETVFYSNGNGLIEVNNNKVTMLLDSVS